jgi:hypothetical protein
MHSKKGVEMIGLPYDLDPSANLPLYVPTLAFWQWFSKPPAHSSQSGFKHDEH